MPIRFPCPQCGEVQSFQDAWAGKTGHCSRCQTLLRIPRTFAEENPFALPPPPPSQRRAEAVLKAPTPVATGVKLGCGIGAGLVVGMAAISLLGMFLFCGGCATLVGIGASHREQRAEQQLKVIAEAMEKEPAATWAKTVKRKLRLLIQEYPGTKAADEAAKVLETIEADEQRDRR